MSETRYDYPLPGADPDRLDAEIRAANLPGFRCVCGSGSMVQAVFAGRLSAPDLQTLDAVIAAHNGTQTADERTEGLRLPPRLQAALAVAFASLPATARQNVPPWAANVIQQAVQAIQEARS